MAYIVSVDTEEGAGEGAAADGGCHCGVGVAFPPCFAPVATKPGSPQAAPAPLRAGEGLTSDTRPPVGAGDVAGVDIDDSLPAVSPAPSAAKLPTTASSKLLSSTLLDTRNVQPPNFHAISTLSVPPGYTFSSAGDEAIGGEMHDMMELSQQSHFRGKLTWRARLRWALLSMQFQAIMVTIIIADVITCLVEMFADTGEGMDDGMVMRFFIVNICILSLYAFEVLLKLIGWGFRSFVRNKWNLMDVVVVILSAMLMNGPGNMVILARLGKVMKSARSCARCCKFCKFVVELNRLFKVMGRCARCCHVFRGANKSQRALKSLYTDGKYRYVNDYENFDLDLTYITTKLVAMCVPVEHYPAKVYRNPVEEVVRFFQEKHPRQSTRIYNLCPECPYKEQKFLAADIQVVRLRIQDHTPPTMDQFVDFLANARGFRHMSPGSVLAVHCRAGKGRTGTVCCAWLIYSRRARNADEALSYFSQRRTDPLSSRLRGVETPSQVRYVQYLYMHLKRRDAWVDSLQPPPYSEAPQIVLHSLELGADFIRRPQMVKTIQVLVQVGRGWELFKALETPLLPADVVSIPLEGVCVRGDIRLSMHYGKPQFNRHEAMNSATNVNKVKGLMALCCVHTNFLTQTEEEENVATKAPPFVQNCFRVPVEMLDKACHRVKTGRHGPGSSVTLVFSYVSEEAGSRS